MARKPIQIDRDKLRTEIRKLASEYVFLMLEDAIELLPQAKLHKIAKKYLDLKRLRPDAEKATRPSLLTDVKRFEKASLAGEYYESFGVNSKNYTPGMATLNRRSGTFLNNAGSHPPGRRALAIAAAVVLFEAAAWNERTRWQIKRPGSSNAVFSSS